MIRYLLTICLALASLAAQRSRNVVLLGHLDRHSYYSDVWGFATSDGREYALVGTIDGTWIVNTTDSSAIREVAFIPGPTSTWRDIRTLGSYAYVVTEGGGGMQIIDMTDPDNPWLVTTWGAGLWGNAHNLCIDSGTGWIYALGTNAGTVVMDASSQPTDPALIGYVPAPYVHDLCVENGLAHVSALNDREYELWDVSSWPFRVLSETLTPGAVAHNAWPNTAQTIAVTTDEVTGGGVQIYDITNRSQPTALANYSANRQSIPHNAFIVGDRCHVSHYTEGYRILDISDPANPAEIGFYDTWPGPSGGFRGAWGCFPFQPSGNVYVSDTASGLYVLRFNDLTIQHTPLPDTLDESGPYVVQANVASSSPVSSVVLDYSVDQGAPTRIMMAPGATAGQFTASIPGASAPARVSYAITATNALGDVRAPDSGAYEFVVGEYQRVFLDDFERGLNGWTHGQTATQDDWQLAVPAGRAGSAAGVMWQDPTTAYSGRHCRGNDLGVAGWNGEYPPNVSNWLLSPRIQTRGARGLRLRLRRWLSVQDAAFDRASILVNDQVVWQNPVGSDLIDTDWQAMELDLSPITDAVASFEIRFTLESDGAIQYGGWAIDDVEIAALADCAPVEQFGAASPGSGGIEPQIELIGRPRINTPKFSIRGTDLLGGATAYLGVGFASGQTSLSGLTILLDPIGAVIRATADGAVGAPGEGEALVVLPIPDRVSLDGLDVYFQWFVVDAGSASGLFSASRGARVRICTR